MRLYVVVAVVLLSGCASQGGIRESWLPQDPAYWEDARKNGASLRLQNGSVYRVIPPLDINRLVLVKERLERVSGVKSELALVETDSPNAFAIVHQGRQIIAFSLSMLDALGADRDALATTMGHELAHLHLGHLKGARKEREDTIKVGQVAGAVMNVLVPWSGTIASVGITAYQQSFTRDEERAADDQGLKWAIEAGYDPCGHYRVARAFHNPSVPFLSSHPGYAERSSLASEYALTATGKGCE
jgi:predicted Zn-dependent protease